MLSKFLDYTRRYTGSPCRSILAPREGFGDLWMVALEAADDALG
jgi:hypothetical protein